MGSMRRRRLSAALSQQQCVILLFFFDIVNADMVDLKQTYIVKPNFICYVLMFFFLFLDKIRKEIGK